MEATADTETDDLQLVIDAVDDSSHAAYILEDLQSTLFEIKERLRERGERTLASSLSVNETALAKAKELVEDAHDAANEVYMRKKAED